VATKPPGTERAAGTGSRGGGRSARRRARELAVQGLYQWLVGGQDAAAIEGHLAESRGRDLDEITASTDMPHYRELLNGAIDGAEALRADFAPYLDRGVEALSPVEHGILLLATYELKHRTEIPYRVIINEAVELAKSFGGTEGFKYVNGVLDKVAAQLRATEVAARS
jgi:transcription antitermination protein NusB